MEVNANPSLNVYNDKELPNGDIEQTLSEIDKFVKTNLLADTINLVSSAPIFQIKKKDDPSQSQQENVTKYQSAMVKEMGGLRLVLPNANKDYGELYIYTLAERIFEYLAG